MKKYSILLGLLLLLLPQLLKSQNTATPAFITDSIDNYINKTISMWQIPGLAIGIVKDGNIILEKGYGVSKLGEDNMVDKNTLFMIGSNTKAFTATALAMLEDDKKCSLNDKVVKWLPQFKMHDTWVTKNANLTDILCHRLGFETFQGDFMYFDSDLSDSAMFEKIGSIKPMYDFRTKWGYCNAGFFVAGKAIEAIAGKEWGAFLQERIFNPLQMNRTFTKVNDMRIVPNASTGHSFVNNTLKPIPYGGLDLLGPAASIGSCVADMDKWTMALLDSGKFENNVIIPQKTIERTRKPESIIGNGRHAYNKNIFKLYGLGWQLSDYEGIKMVSHTGGVHGYVTSVTLVPKYNLGIVILTNTDQNWAYEALKWVIVDAFMDLPYHDYCGNWHNYFQKKITKDSLQIQQWHDSASMSIKTTLALNKYAGNYTSNVYGKIELKAEKGYLLMTLEHHPELTGKLEHIGNNRFLCTYSNSAYGTKVLPFIIDGKKVKSFTLSVADNLEFTTYEFVKN